MGIKVQDGCNNRCSYCIVWKARGPERSVPVEAVLRQVREAERADIPEVVLTGVNLGAYDGVDARDAHVEIDELLNIILRETDIQQVRLSSLEPMDVDERLIDAMVAGGPRVAPFLHLPLQSGCSATLERMNRPYTAEQYEATVAMIRAKLPAASISCDIIAGFPGETDDEFAQSLALCERVGFSRMHVFRYSARPGTPAAKLDDPTPREEKQKWFDALCNAQNAISAEKHAAYIGRTVRVLVEGESDDADWPLSARTEGNRLVRMKGDKSLIGTFTTAKISGSNTWALYGADEETIGR